MERQLVNAIHLVCMNGKEQEHYLFINVLGKAEFAVRLIFNLAFLLYSFLIKIVYDNIVFLVKKRLRIY